MNWTAGYASDVEYTAGFYREQSPTYLDFTCVLNGFEPIAVNRPFTYFELGFGRGLTANILAAANPHGKFYATDFNPAHVAGAQQLAADAQLSNLTLLENSFSELAEGQVPNLPQFDFMTLHGIYTWVTAENRQHIVRFINRYLKPGGVVFASYNAMPGWSSALPLQRLLIEHADLYPNRSDFQIKQAAAFIGKLNDAEAAYFKGNAILAARLEKIKSSDAAYLVHEYMHRHWQPLYHADVARDFSAAKLDYAGSAELLMAYPELLFSAAQRELIESISDPVMRETLKDYLINTAFRKDVFIRGGRQMTAARRAEWLQQVGISLTIPRADVQFAMKWSLGEINGKEELYGPVFDALAQRPHTLAELLTLPELKERTTLGKLAQVAATLTVSGQGLAYFAGESKIGTESAHKMNRVITAQTRYGDEFQVLASPLLGNGVALTYVDRLVYSLIAAHPDELDVSTIVKRAWQIMQAQGRRLTKDGKPLSTEDQNLVELHAQVQAILIMKLPFWKQLDLL